MDARNPRLLDAVPQRKGDQTVTKASVAKLRTFRTFDGTRLISLAAV